MKPQRLWGSIICPYIYIIGRIGGFYNRLSPTFSICYLTVTIGTYKCMMVHMTLTTEPTREHLHGSTGIFVRAQGSDGRWGNADIAELTRDSLTEWLRSRGGENEWAEGVVALLLGWGQ